jgi:hypothetical protein
MVMSTEMADGNTEGRLVFAMVDILWGFHRETTVIIWMRF